MNTLWKCEVCGNVNSIHGEGVVSSSFRGFGDTIRKVECLKCYTRVEVHIKYVEHEVNWHVYINGKENKFREPKPKPYRKKEYDNAGEDFDEYELACTPEPF